MKKIIIALIAVLATAANINAQSLTYPVAIDATNFPDQYFRAWVAGTSVDKNADGYLSQTEANAITTINSISNFSNITTYKGIEYFSQLVTFNTGNPCANLENLDLTKNVALESVQIYSDNFTTLDLSKNTALKNLAIFGNYSDNSLFTSLDLSNNTALKTLQLRNCYALSSLNLPNTNSLTDIRLKDLGIASIDLSNNTSVSWLELCLDSVSNVDLSSNVLLSNVSVAGKNINEIEFPISTTLKTLTIGGNMNTTRSLTSIDLSNLTALTTLAIKRTSIAPLDLSNNINLRSLNVSQNYNLTTLDLSHNVNLTGELNLEQNNFTELDVSYLTGVTKLVCFQNYLTSLNVPSSLTSLNCSNNLLSSLDVSNCTLLSDLNIDKNSFRSQDSIKLASGISYNIISAQSMWIYDNNLTITGTQRDEIKYVIDEEITSTIQIYEPSNEKGTLQNLYSAFKERDDHTRTYSIYCRMKNTDITYEDGKTYVTLYKGTTDFDRLFIGSTVANQNLIEGYSKAMSVYAMTRKTFGYNSVVMNYTNEPFFSLYLNPLSIANNGENIYTGTMCLPYSVNIPTDGDVRVYIATGITRESEEVGKLILEEITTGIVPPNTPVVVTASQPGMHIFTMTQYRTHEKSLVKDNVTNQITPNLNIYKESTDLYPSNILRGSWYETENVTPYSILTLGRRTDDGSGTIGFWNYKGNKTGLYRCYVPSELIPSAMMSPKLKGLSFKFPDEVDEVTSIETEPIAYKTKSIDSNGACYDLQGRRVSHPQRGGVYIINGKKVIF